jgi:uncharacterized Ntn-hydrolase superfamily protein
LRRWLASAVACFLTIGVLASPAAATWSIVAVDAETREVGVAGASCIGGVEIIGGVVPGRGVIAAQAFANIEARDLAKRRFEAGASPPEILSEITDPDWDPDQWFNLLGGRSLRQYGLAGLGQEPGPTLSSVATFTGEDTSTWAGSREGKGVAVAGNLLAGSAVLDEALAAYEATPGDCEPELAERLLSALAAGGDEGGDRRCEPQVAALSAFLEVAAPTDLPGASSLRLVIPVDDDLENRFLVQAWRFFVPKPGDPDDNPVRKLRERYLERFGGNACLFDPTSDAYQTVR